MSNNLYAFSKGTLIGIYTNSKGPNRFKREALPDDVFISWIGFSNVRRWYKKDFTPILDSDVPKELKVALLLLGE